MLLKFGELALKGRNRPLFVNALSATSGASRPTLAALEVRHRGGVFIVTGQVPQEELVERCLGLPGVSVVQPAVRCERDARRRPIPPSRCCAAAPAAPSPSAPPAATSASRCARSSSSRVIGDAVRVRLGLDVDLSNPDLAAYVEVDHKELLVSVERLRGAGGLPVGSSGRALVLLSGGLDWPWPRIG